MVEQEQSEAVASLLMELFKTQLGMTLSNLIQLDLF